MAIYLVTGTPGAGKTLNTIKTVKERADKELRPVYYANIKGITFANWHELSGELTPLNWFDCPDGAIILIDECQDFYPAMSATAKQPEYIMRFATHRHQGFDIYLITQGPSLINSKIKDWVNPHVHYRRIWGGKVVYRYINEQVVSNIRDFHEVSKAAIREKVGLDKAYFGAYQSAVMHMENKRVNKKLIAVFAFGFLALTLLWAVRFIFH